jgi:hypothetical protein
MATGPVRDVWLLPLLEKPYAVVVADLGRSLAGLGFPSVDPQAVSLRDQICLALTCGQAYWAGLAVDWLASGVPLDDELVRGADRLVGDKVIAVDSKSRSWSGLGMPMA